MKVLLITMDVSTVLKTLEQSSINLIGVIESKSKKSTHPNEALRSFCKEHGLSYYWMNEGCDDKLEQWVSMLKPDLIAVYVMAELLKANIIDIPKYGCINLHPSLLPNLRGSHPIFWTFYEGDLNPGVTVHYIDEGEDSGDIIFQKRVPIPLGTTEEELIELVEGQAGAKLLIEAIEAIEHQAAPRRKQPNDVNYQRARKIEEVEYKTVINWAEWELERIWHVLRGTQNWLNVYDFSQVQGVVTSWSVLHYEKLAISETFESGKVLEEDGTYFIRCRQGKIYLQLSVKETKEVMLS